MTKTRGNLTIEDIKIGDIHYEFDYGFGIKCEVLTTPIRNNDKQWTWLSKNVNTGEEIEYLVTEGFEHYGPKLYNYEAYIVEKWI